MIGTVEECIRRASSTAANAARRSEAGLEAVARELEAEATKR
jgi:hypothetical protein